MQFILLFFFFFLKSGLPMKSMTMMTGKSLKGKSYLVTGSTDGIGEHTALRLVERGARVLLHGRSLSKLIQSTEKILKAYPDASLCSYMYDLSSISSVKLFAEEVLNSNEQLDGLINNAGIFSESFSTTTDGMELTFAVNVAAPYMLSCLLLPLLKKTAKSKILNVSSTSQGGRPDFKNLQFETGGFSAHSSYSFSKLYMAAFSHELAKRISPEESMVISCDPGTVNTKMLEAGWGMYGIDLSTANDQFNLIAADYKAEDHGKYYVSCQETRCTSAVYDDVVRNDLFKELERLTGVKPPVYTPVGAYTGTYTGGSRLEPF